jgi:hypothetical protein
MTTTVIQPGARGADYAYWRPTTDELKALGFSFVVRYIAPGDQTRPKVVSKAEIDALHAGGIAVLIVFEWRITDAFGGGRQGNEYGLWAKNKLRELGYPKGLPCIVAVDTDSIQQATLSAVESYLRAFALALSPDYKLGVYGGTRVMSRVKDLSVLNWKANARSWSPLGFRVPVHAEQGKQEPAHRFDPNLVKLPIPAWLPTGSTVPPEPRRNLRKGMVGPDVRWVQQVYRDALGYRITVDGIYGDETADFTRWFQGGHGLTVSGWVNKATWAKVIEVSGQ